MLGYVLQQQGNNDKALDLCLKAQPMAEKLKDSFALAWIFRNMGNVFEATKELPRAKYNFLNAIKFTSVHDIRIVPMASVSLSLGKIYFNSGQLDSAKYYAERSFNQVPLLGSLLLLGDVYKKQGNKKMSMYYYQGAVDKGIALNNPLGLSEAYQRLAIEFMENKKVDSAFLFARKAYNISVAVKNPYNIAQTGKFLSGLFEKARMYDSAFIYQQVVINVNDSLFTSEKEKLINNLLFKEQLKEQEIKSEQDKFKSKVWIYSLSGGFVLLLFAAGFLIRNNRQKRHANTLLQHQKDQIQTTLSALKATQSQLIQSEKMASLGELTAGIAHEIQNPLNFVNNFSELSRELLSEMDEEAEKGNMAEVKAISAGIRQNLEKINHHGRRADSIVKGMLQHSQKGSGLKEPTDINALAEEYLRLSYHGLRAKDNTMNASMMTSLDESIGKVDLVQQDISRVLLNLCNNAFYSAAEKYKVSGGTFKPVVHLTTKKHNDHIEIRVNDNGSGIPEDIMKKIFNPFFTTKPTGQGTGLGLSLSYDIVKAHGGELTVESAAGEGATFIIRLPIISG
jgi:signal transduction histidine kinase